MNELREKVIKGFTCCDGAAIHLGHCQEDCPYFGESERADKCVEKLHSDALSLLKAQEQEIQQLKTTHISASGNATACGVIHGGVTINQKAKEIMNIKNVEVFNG